MITWLLVASLFAQVTDTLARYDWHPALAASVTPAPHTPAGKPRPWILPSPVEGSWFEQTPPQPTALQNDSLLWDYRDLDAHFGGIALFLICLDGQPTVDCARVAYGPIPDPPTDTYRTYSWRFPRLTPGAHRATIQACTAEANACSPGLVVTFAFVPTLLDPVNGRIGKGGL